MSTSSLPKATLSNRILQLCSPFARHGAKRKSRRHSFPLEPATQVLEDRRVLSASNLGILPTHDILTADHNDWTSVRAEIGVGQSASYYFYVGAKSGVFFDVDAHDQGFGSGLNSYLSVSRLGGSVVGANDDGYDFEGFSTPLGTGVNSPTQLGFQDPSLYLDLSSGWYFATIRGVGNSSGEFEFRVLADSNYTSTVPQFSSNPGASDSLYLDFDGYSSTSDAWTKQDTDGSTAGIQPIGKYEASPYSLDGSPQTFSPQERLAIQNIYRIVSEDYSPFAINVTTAQPSSLADKVGFRQVITSSAATLVGREAGTLGVAFINSYASTGTSGEDNTGFTFASSFSHYGGGSSGYIMAATVEQGNTSSHEFGHALGLGHFDTASNSIGVSVVPNGIMATLDRGLNRELWSSGYASLGEDLQENPIIRHQNNQTLIGSYTNTFRYKADDHQTSTTSATNLGTTDRVIHASGIISHSTDYDTFAFNVVSAGVTTVNLNIDEYTSNLAATITLYNSSNRQVARIGGSDRFEDILSEHQLAPGKYYVRVGGGGLGASGQYELTIQTKPIPEIVINNVTVTESSGFATFTVSLSGDVPGGFMIDYFTREDSRYSATIIDGDFSHVSGTLTFTGLKGEKRQFSVPIHEDQKVEGNEGILAFLHNLRVTNATQAVRIADNQGAAIIIDNDTASISINNIYVNENVGTAIFTVTLVGEVDGGFSVQYLSVDDSRLAATVADGDYVPVSGVLNINGTPGELQYISVTINEDSKFETTEAFLIYLRNIVAPRVGNNRVTISDNQGACFIYDNDYASRTGQSSSYLSPASQLVPYVPTFNYSSFVTPLTTWQPYNYIVPQIVSVPVYRPVATSYRVYTFQIPRLSEIADDRMGQDSLNDQPAALGSTLDAVFSNLAGLEI